MFTDSQQIAYKSQQSKKGRGRKRRKVSRLMWEELGGKKPQQVDEK